MTGQPVQQVWLGSEEGSKAFDECSRKDLISGYALACHELDFGHKRLKEAERDRDEALKLLASHAELRALVRAVGRASDEDRPVLAQLLIERAR